MAAVSAQGRYVACSDDSKPLREGMQIVDLESGQILFKTEIPAFSPDNDAWFEINSDEQRTSWMVFRSLKTGHELRRMSVPDIPLAGIMRAKSWDRESVTIGYKTHIAESISENGSRNMVEVVRRRTYRIVDNELVEIADFPVDQGFGDGDQSEIAYSGAGWSGRFERVWTEPFREVRSIQNVLKWIPGSGRLFETGNRYYWHQKTPVSCRRFEVSMLIAVSPDGQWLASGENVISLWRLPQRFPWSKILMTIATPWILWWVAKKYWSICRKQPMSDSIS